MPATLFVVHGSHPCAAVARALEMKGIAHRTVELPPPTHAALMPLLFGGRTVPALRLAEGERLQGSRAILRRLDELVPDPPLVPAEPELHARVLAAEAWGDEVLQPAARRILWPTLLANAAAAPSFMEGARLRIPPAALRASMPLIGRIELRMNDASPAARARDLRALPGWADRVDAWLADGTLGGASVTAADLQIAPSLALLLRMGDVRGLIGERRCARWAEELFPGFHGELPVGAIPAAEVAAATA